jgi:hypothetical protein
MLKSDPYQHSYPKPKEEPMSETTQDGHIGASLDDDGIKIEISWDNLSHAITLTLADTIEFHKQLGETMDQCADRLIVDRLLANLGDEEKADQESNPWKDTVRNLYDELLVSSSDMLADSRLADSLLDVIEEAHPDYFNGPDTKADQEGVSGDSEPATPTEWEYYSTRCNTMRAADMKFLGECGWELCSVCPVLDPTLQTPSTLLEFWFKRPLNALS